MEIKQRIQQCIEVKQALMSDDELLERIRQMSNLAVDVLKQGGRILLCGNGGSAADAQHIAAELSGRFAFDREPIDAEALHVNTSYLTAVANDYSFADVYSRLLKAKGRKGDMLIAISTSGNSENIVQAVNVAKELEMITVGFTGHIGGKLKNLVDLLINVPSNETPRIQETHILIGHIFCELIENKIFKP